VRPVIVLTRNELLVVSLELADDLLVAAAAEPPLHLFGAKLSVQTAVKGGSEPESHNLSDLTLVFRAQ